MKDETTIRGLLALTSVSLCILLFFFLENQRKFDEYKVITTKQIDSLSNKYDSLYDEHFQLSHENGILNLQIFNLSQENPKYKNLEKDLEKDLNTNKYE
jgi:hypothetical protein